MSGPVKLPGIGHNSRVSVSLRPPLVPSPLGDCDFWRAVYFKELSAVGNAAGPVEVLARDRGTNGVLASA